MWGLHGLPLQCACKQARQPHSPRPQNERTCTGQERQKQNRAERQQELAAGNLGDGANRVGVGGPGPEACLAAGIHGLGVDGGHPGNGRQVEDGALLQQQYLLSGAAKVTVLGPSKFVEAVKLIERTWTLCKSTRRELFMWWRLFWVGGPQAGKQIGCCRSKQLPHPLFVHTGRGLSAGAEVVS